MTARTRETKDSTELGSKRATLFVLMAIATATALLDAYSVIRAGYVGEAAYIMACLAILWRDNYKQKSESLPTFLIALACFLALNCITFLRMSKESLLLPALAIVMLIWTVVFLVERDPPKVEVASDQS